MYFTTLFRIALASGAAMSIPLSKESPASPLVNRDAVNVGYGQQIQISDDTNHWVVWVEGESACPATQTLSVLNTSPCDQLFTLSGGSWQLANCNGNNEPQALEDADGNVIHTCTLDSDKINCHDGLHDIVKHGKCI